MTTTKVIMINSVLEKKLEELESLCEAITFNDDDPNVYRDIELRVIFAKTLLAAEISSRPMDMEGEVVSEERLKLACMAKKLNELEEVFKTNQLLSGHDNGSVTEPETRSMESNDGVVEFETGSVDSWVESCLNEVTKTEEVEEKEEDAEQCPLFQDASSEENKEATFLADASSEEKEEVTFPAEEKEVVVREVIEKRRLGFKALVFFGLIGLVGAMISLLGHIGDDMKEDGFFLTPT